MKRITFILTLMLSISIFAQVTNEGEPISWKQDIEKSVDYIKLPLVDLTEIVEEDIVRDNLQGVPYRVGVPIDAPYSTQNSGDWTLLENGDKIWRIGLHSEGAVQISVNFKRFYLPEGASVYLYNGDRTDLLGAYTHIQNQKSGVLGTWFVQGDRLWIEYHEPKNVAGLGELSIENIIHCYRSADEHQLGIVQEKLNQSGDCNHDVDCPIGSDWEDYRELNKRAVAYLNMNNGYICSGGLVNNTAFDYTPYFLTAHHCYDGSNPASWAMRFNWISPNPVCASTANSQQGPTYMTISGSTLRANHTATDFCLVEINNNPPTAWDLTWAGWDKTDSNTTYQVGIHHPSGDIMKICRDDDPAVQAIVNGKQAWRISSATGGWELGVTEGGSSGSPLYDQNGRVIGQLWAGAAACSGTNDNNQYDLYGRFGKSWDYGSTASTRLKEWLDPLNTDPDYIDAHYFNVGVDEYSDDMVNIFPNPTNGLLNLKLKSSSDEYTYTLTDILGQQMEFGKLVKANTTIDLSHLNVGIYFLKISNKEESNIITRKIVLNK